MTRKRYVVPFLLIAIMTASILLHLHLIKTLNVVEDESAYMMDAWQISADVLPFREFGATKGPVFLFLLKGWQLLMGQTLFASRLFTSLLHVISIPLLYFFAQSITQKRFTALLAAALWGLVPAAVSLTTNVIHAPLELVWVLSAATLLVRRPQKKSTHIWAALFFFLAVLTRATAIAFLPLILLLIFWRPSERRSPATSPASGTEGTSPGVGAGPRDNRASFTPGEEASSTPGVVPARVRTMSFLTFCLTGALLLAITIAIIYPLYGWPKTAFFFNADAILIAEDQQAAYQQVLPSGFTMLFRGLVPLWYEGLALILLAAALPFLSIRAITLPLRLVISCVLVLLAFLAYQPLFDNLAGYWSGPDLLSVKQSAQVAFISLAAIAALALIFPAPKIALRRQIFVLTAIIVWLAAFIGFYRFWGRDPSPFYILESIPAFCVAAGVALHNIISRSRIIGGIAIAIVAASLLPPFAAVSYKQYRGTVSPDAAIAAGAAIEKHVPPGEAIFTAQPSYAYLGKRPLYKHLTHPGWYLAEQAGIVPTSIRRTFFPDMEDLTRDVEREVNWIVVDWRTNDVYFKEGVEETQGLRDLLANEFAPIAEIPNDVTEPIILYKRKHAQ